MLEYSHDSVFVLASLAIALMAGFSGLSLTRGISALDDTRRRIVISIAAVILGWGIWSMHFVAMLGLELPVLFYYDALTTMISALTAILIAGLALLVLHTGRRTTGKIVLAGGIIGIGIPVMHYIGMSGIELCQPVYSVSGVALAFAVSMVLGVTSVFACYSHRSHVNILVGTLGFGLAVFTVHFVAMWGTGFRASPPSDGVGLVMGNDILAFGVTLSAFVLSGGFLLSGASFVESLSRRGSDGGAPAMAEPDEAPGPPPAAPDPLPAPVAVEGVAPAAPAPAGPDGVSPGITRLPYEQNAQTHFVKPHDVLAVRAEGRYTLVYTADEKLFCPWSISEVARRIPDSVLTRTHRSYLVNLDRVSTFERKKDTGVCHFDAAPALEKVPVSRSHLAEVRDRLGL
ncbi:MHYT domain-containing protein [Roseovarius salinarum]|uniref:MHYT domain-containing protein n=1 Tax=Roseovarius salinarum TaxID=1981892 RepID=UPI000C3242FB|nr:MHYT domain-containing protein [Roseovarius salinarum]